MRGGGGVTWLAAGADFSSFPPELLLVFLGIRPPVRIAANAVLDAITPCDSLSALLTVPCCTIDHLHSSRP